jgi:Arc/MetJ-type ribon-helix-helix transcriptional regulator
MGIDMNRIKPRGRYLAVSVPIALHKEITEHVLKTSYNSIAAFVTDAVREKIASDDMRRDMHLLSPAKWSKKHDSTIKERIKGNPVNTDPLLEILTEIHDDIDALKQQIKSLTNKKTKNP